MSGWCCLPNTRPHNEIVRVEIEPMEIRYNELNSNEHSLHITTYCGHLAELSYANVDELQGMVDVTMNLRCEVDPIDWTA